MVTNRTRLIRKRQQNASDKGQMVSGSSAESWLSLLVCEAADIIAFTIIHLPADPFHFVPYDMRINTLLAALAVAMGEVMSYDADIHPEFQEGLSINDVPADRRLHWMRVANEVSHDSTLIMLISAGGLC
jgi:hypothetical protein